MLKRCSEKEYFLLNTLFRLCRRVYLVELNLQLTKICHERHEGWDSNPDSSNKKSDNHSPRNLEKNIKGLDFSVVLGNTNLRAK